MLRPCRLLLWQVALRLSYHVVTGKAVTGKTVTGKAVTGKAVTGKVFTGKFSSAAEETNLNSSQETFLDS